MAIIECPACRQRVSTISRRCARCGAELTSASPDGDVRRDRQRRRQLHLTLTLHAVVSMLTVIGGVYWYFADARAGRDGTYARYVIGVGVLWYAVTRVRTWLKR